ncbi:hypothetical protein [Streptomyces sp. NBC_01304]|uniref:hypothetical protein n=1 Tax=Streptomyces sp. NBC_01304 TaxID=2903818 RepID=UPI002E113D0A|nr:hypothetical protein OG430_28200 [Streptomyces sp. NBC_01304]
MTEQKKPKAEDITTQDNHMPSEPADKTVYKPQDNHMPSEPKAADITTMDNHMPAPPAK